MATETKSATAPTEADTFDTTCFDTEGLGEMVATMANATVLSGSISQYAWEAWVYESDDVGGTTGTIYISKDAGSSYCSGHAVSYVFDAGCDGGNPSVSGTCDHSNAPLTESEAKTNSLRIKIENDGVDGLPFINYVEHTWTYSLGYGNKVLGVASANIAKINGVETANIEKVAGAS